MLFPRTIGRIACVAFLAGAALAQGQGAALAAGDAPWP
jgi:hypothetical protein